MGARKTMIRFMWEHDIDNNSSITCNHIISNDDHSGALVKIYLIKNLQLLVQSIRIKKHHFTFNIKTNQLKTVSIDTDKAHAASVLAK